MIQSDMPKVLNIFARTQHLMTSEAVTSTRHAIDMPSNLTIAGPNAKVIPSSLRIFDLASILSCPARLGRDRTTNTGEAEKNKK